MDCCTGSICGHSTRTLRHRAAARFASLPCPVPSRPSFRTRKLESVVGDVAVSVQLVRRTGRIRDRHFLTVCEFLRRMGKASKSEFNCINSIALVCGKAPISFGFHCHVVEMPPEIDILCASSAFGAGGGGALELPIPKANPFENELPAPAHRPTPPGCDIKEMPAPKKP